MLAKLGFGFFYYTPHLLVCVSVCDTQTPSNRVEASHIIHMLPMEGSVRKTKRWNRLKISSEMASILKREYDLNMFPTLDRRRQLASTLNEMFDTSVTARNIQVWFQNRRQRSKMRIDSDDVVVETIDTRVMTGGSSRVDIDRNTLTILPLLSDRYHVPDVYVDVMVRALSYTCRDPEWNMMDAYERLVRVPPNQQLQMAYTAWTNILLRERFFKGWPCSPASLAWTGTNV